MQQGHVLRERCAPSIRRGIAPLAVVLALATTFDAVARAAPQQQSSTTGATGATGATAPPRPVTAVLTGAARADYEAGLVLFQDHDDANAIIKFERVYELSGEPRVLWDVALCQWHLRRYSRVIATVEKLLHDGGSSLSAQDRKDAEDLIEATKPYVSRLDLRVSGEGATVLVDGRKVGVTPLRERVLLDVGQREIRISKAGFREVKVVREVSGGGDTALSVLLEKEIHRGRLSVDTGPEDFIAIDGKILGRGAWEGALPSGGHTLRVTAPGMLAHQAEVMLQDDQARRVSVRLTPLARDELARWLWIGGGAALLAGAVVAGALVFRAEPPTPGSVEPPTVQVNSRGGGIVVGFGGGR